ncbi:hypothetical protein GCM10027416_32770 [Okibacterium endophyticum]
MTVTAFPGTTGTGTAGTGTAGTAQSRRTIVRPAPKPSAAVTVPTAGIRDRSIDLVRAGCLIVVVALHAMMVGVTMGDSGPVFENAIADTDWFPAASWFLQMMPLFFIAGGFSSITGWQRARATGATPASFVAGRLHRLLMPAIVVIGAVGVALLALSAAGVSAEMVAIAGFRISQPLWFLGVYVLCQALVPLLVLAHERRPVATLVVLGALAAGIDATRIATGIEAIGFVNLAFVWLFVQQLGFWLVRIETISTSARLGLAAVAFGGLIVLTAVGPYSADMYVNLNPPTLAIIGLAVGQVFLLSLAQPMLRRWAERPTIARVADAIGTRSMTIYLWHMPVLIGLAGLSVLVAPLLGLGLPAIGSDGWWATRPAWLVIAFVAVGLVTLLTARFEHRAARHPGASGRRVALGSITGVASVAVLFALGLSAPVAALSVLLMFVTLRIATQRGAAGMRAAAAATTTRTRAPADVVPQTDAVATRG